LNTSFQYLDSPVIKAEHVEEKNFILKTIYDRLYPNYLSVDRGFVKMQRVLIFGKLIYKNDNFYLKPRLFIGSGLVEYEELIEFLKAKQNVKIFNMLLLFSGISLIHFIIKLNKS
jgi:hypothetical protein